MWRRRVKLMYRRLYQPGDGGEAEVRVGAPGAHRKTWAAALCPSTCAAVERQPGAGVELLDEELRQRDPVVGAQGLVAAFPVEHQVFVRVRI
ncbi:hypothetical protein EYF80_052935 [Liparis tanakae]|uniref:Uncharacterized protein n=1 Tax=Liparis tanakae TaxID=230148 RepID=A0A4Z2F7R2_9TELE|nr:hypothetical protein EYF80_052935 [Liparis tanakae]